VTGLAISTSMFHRALSLVYRWHSNSAGTILKNQK